MHIDSYSFGEMRVNGEVYTKDLIVFPDKITPNWWRCEGHSLGIEDLEQVLSFDPDVLIVGTGSSGLMRIPQATRKALQGKHIELRAGFTDQAVLIFNEQIKKGTKVAGVFHLTC